MPRVVDRVKLENIYALETAYSENKSNSKKVKDSLTVVNKWIESFLVELKHINKFYEKTLATIVKDFIIM